MPDFPLLVFPRATDEPRRNLHGGAPKLIRPTAEQQKERLNAKFERIANSFIDLRQNQEGIEPEQVIVFEVTGESINNLARAASQIPNLEWLAEAEIEDIDPTAGFMIEDRADEKLKCRLYALMTNQRAMADLISEWNAWLENPGNRAKRFRGPFKDLFINLIDLRRWDFRDRLAEANVVEYWQERIDGSSETIKFEIEFWFRSSPQLRERAYRELESLIASAGGQCLHQTVVPEILYHGVLAELPSQKIKEFLEEVGRNSAPALFRCEEVMLFRPEAQASFPLIFEESEAVQVDPLQNANQLVEGEPLIALLDGVPLARHKFLNGHLIIDDPDDAQSKYSLEQMQHGTSMAGLIVNGDLSNPTRPLKRPIYVRPILQPETDFSGNLNERTPDNRLLIDLIHSAIRRMKIGEGDTPTAPTVHIVNLSFGNSYQPFDRNISPLGKLLDWLSWNYNLLFIVSTGNQKQSIKLDSARFDLNDTRQRMEATLNAIWDDQRKRRLFSPSESVNSLTIGALHRDSSSVPPIAHRVDLLNNSLLPSPISTICNGFKRAVKPDILFPGGRQLYQKIMTGGVVDTYEISRSNLGPGQKVCTSSRFPLVLNNTIYTCGTSNATALASRAAGILTEELDNLRTEPGGERLELEFLPVIIKSLLVHGASWGEASQILDTVFSGLGLSWHHMERLKSRFLGFGEANLEKSMQCADNRVTIIGWDSIGEGQGHVYKVPLPPSLSGSTEKRRLTFSLAWLSPINPKHAEYKRAGLWFDLTAQQKEKLGIGERSDLDQNSSKRGAIQHQIFEGELARPIIDGDHIEFTVNCREVAGSLEERVPYAITVSLEVAAPTTVEVYQEVKERIRPPVSISPSPAPN